MGAFKKMAEYLGLVDGELDQDDLLSDEAVPDRSTLPTMLERADRIERRGRPEGLSVVTAAPGRSGTAGSSSGATALRPGVITAQARVPAKISTHSPRSYNDARPIGEDFREGTPVIMNLTELDDADAKRIVDFAAGLVFGLQGSIQRVTTKVFLLSPANVDVSAQAHEQVERGDFYNQS